MATDFSSEVPVEQLRETLFKAAEADDEAKTAKLCKDVNERGLKLTTPALRRIKDNGTVLHCALVHKSWRVAKYLINLYATEDQELLVDAGCQRPAIQLTSRRKKRKSIVLC